MPSTGRTNESPLIFAADKTEPGAYNLPLYLSFADPMYYCPVLLLSSTSMSTRAAPARAPICL